MAFVVIVDKIDEEILYVYSMMMNVHQGMGYNSNRNRNKDVHV